ncbi:MAG: MFS transporter [Actinobacteria bacterium]|nr:MAG: MFS transporter [Actinomycetota bacterium]
MRTRLAYKRLAGNKNFRLLLLAQGISNMGDWLVIGILLAFAQREAGTFAAAGVLVAKLLPALIFSPLIGALVDRVDRKKGMILCDIIRGLLIFALAFLLMLNNIWLVLLIIFLVELFTLFYVPAKDASIPNMVDKELILTANSLSFTINQMTMLFGLAFGATVVLVVNKIWAFVPIFKDFLGSYTAVFIDGLTFFTSAIILLFVVLPKPKRLGKQSYHSILGDITDTFDFLKKYPKIRSIIISAGVSVFGLGTILAVGTDFSKRVLGGEQDVLPLLTTLAFGLFTGAILVGKISRFTTKENIFSASMLFLGLALSAFALSSNYLVAIILGFSSGFGLGMLYVSTYTMLHEYVADVIRGRLITTLEADLRLAVLISAVIAAALTKAFGNTRTIQLASLTYPLPGSRLVLIFGGLVVIFTSVFAFFSVKHHKGELSLDID